MERFAVILVLFAISVAALQPPTTSKKYRDDYEYHPDTNAFYKLHTEEVEYETAIAACKTEGAALMVASSIRDILAVHAMFKLFPDIGDYVWIGDDGEVHESAEEQAMIDFSSEEQQDMPSLLSTRNSCPVLTREGQIEDRACNTRIPPYFANTRLPFVCKVDLASAPYDPQCDVYSKDYEYKEDLGSCYKVSAVAYTWNQAYSECQQEGAHLVVLNSKAESQEVKRLMSSKPLISQSYGPYYYIAGIRADRSAGEGAKAFRTIFNETLEAAGFAEWAETEPNNISGEEYCGSLFETDGKYNDQPCAKPYGFICEKEKHTRLDISQ